MTEEESTPILEFLYLSLSDFLLTIHINNPAMTGSKIPFVT